MPYTLGKVFVWFVLAAGLGLAIGWFAHRVFSGVASASRQRAPARDSGSAVPTGGAADVHHEVGPAGAFGDTSAIKRVVAERDRLRLELDEVRAASIAAINAAAAGDAKGRSSWTDTFASTAPAAPRTGGEQADAEALRAERDRWRQLAHRHEATIGVQAATIDRMQSQLDGAPGTSAPSGEPSSWP